MIDPRAIELAKSQGYRPHGSWQHMFCDFEFWKCLAKAVKYEGEPLELAREFLPLMFAVTHPADLEGYHDEDCNLQSAWDALVEPPGQERPAPQMLGEYEDDRISERASDKIHGLLKKRLGADIYVSWLAFLQFSSVSNGVLIATVPVKFLASWIKEHYYDDLLQVCAEVFEGVERVEVVLRHPGMTRTI
jgi:hypothetical protein